jgi:predicted aminopeptidase
LEPLNPLFSIAGNQSGKTQAWANYTTEGPLASFLKHDVWTKCLQVGALSTAELISYFNTSAKFFAKYESILEFRSEALRE